MLHFARGTPDADLRDDEILALLRQMLGELGASRRVLLVPPDFTRAHSYAGEITTMLHRELVAAGAQVAVLPALGTHSPMTDEQKRAMFPGIPPDAFRVHNWREGLTDLGEVPASFVSKVTGTRLNCPIRCEVNSLIAEGGWDRIISVGQLVPHEVAGIANHNKNIFTGLGGADTINKTHFIGAVCGMEGVMGRAASPVRAVYDYMGEKLAPHLPISYVLTVRSAEASGRLATRGLFAGDDRECYRLGARLCRQVNLDLLEEPLNKAVVYLDSGEFKSTWLGNKAIYRTRMAMANGGELIVLGPGVREFGEDRAVDLLIRKYGYRGTPATLEAATRNEDLGANLSAAAHLIHGSTEGRFRVTYCPGGLSRSEIESVGFAWGDLQAVSARYQPKEAATAGWRTTRDGEKYFFIPNPALGLWAMKAGFEI
jgi:nickel-dependent lactate racemase